MIVKYSKKFPYAPYLNEDIGFEIEVEPKDGVTMKKAAMDTLAWLKEIAEKFHKENNPKLEGDIGYSFNQQTGEIKFPQGNQPIPTKDISEDRKIMTEADVVDIISQIEKCRNMEEVAKYKYLANQSEQVRKHYLNKLKQFV